DVPAFQVALRTAIESAQEGALVTFGIEPRSAETGFGYLKAVGDETVRTVQSFHEKPDHKTAESFLASGGYFWNSGMFVWRASAIRRAIGSTLPDLASVLDRIESAAKDSGNLDAAIREHFAASPAISIDHGVLEKCGGLRMVPGDFGWSDVGSWD